MLPTQVLAAPVLAITTVVELIQEVGLITVAITEVATGLIREEE